MPLIATVPVYGGRIASLTSTVRGSNLQCYSGTVYTLSKIGSVPPVSSSDSAAVPVLSLALFHYRSDMEGPKRQYVAVSRILSMVQTLKVSTDHGWAGASL